MCNGDVMSYDDGVKKMVHPENRIWNPHPEKEELEEVSQKGIHYNVTPPNLPFSGEGLKPKNLDGFMIGRASFGNPWCFIP